MCVRRLLLSLPSSAPSLRCGCLPIHWDTGFHPSASEVSDSGGQEVRGLCLLWSLGTQAPSILSLCSLLVVFACMFKNWVLEVSVPVGGSQKEGVVPWASHKAEAPPATCVSVSSARTESLICAWLQGSRAVGLLSRKRVSEKGSRALWWWRVSEKGSRVLWWWLTAHSTAHQ